MEALGKVEKEVDKAISKFEHFEKFWETILGGLVLSLDYLHDNFNGCLLHILSFYLNFLFQIQILLRKKKF